MKTTECTSECARGVGRSVHSTFVFPHHLGVRLVSRGGMRSGGLPCLSALSLSLMTAGFLFCGAASPVLANSVYGDISDPYMVSDHVVLEDYYADHSATNVTQSGHLELLDTNFYTDNLEVSGQLTVGSGAYLENVYGPAEEFAGTAELHPAPAYRSKLTVMQSFGRLSAAAGR